MIRDQFFPGDQLQSVGAFRAFVAACLVGLPSATIEDGRLVASELAGNAATHSRSRLPGGKYLGRVEIASDAVLIEVVDQGSEEVPEVVGLADDVDYGRGLLICSKLGQLMTDTTPDGGRRVAVRLPLPTSEDVIA